MYGIFEQVGWPNIGPVATGPVGLVPTALLSVGHVQVDVLTSNLLGTQGLWSQRKATELPFAIALAQHRTQFRCILIT